MSRMEKALLYGTAALALALLVGSGIFGRGLVGSRLSAPVDVAYAAEPTKLTFEDSRLDVLRRGVQFAYLTHVSEEKRARELTKSTADFDRRKGVEALGRSRDWANIELSLRALFLWEVQRLMKDSNLRLTKSGQLAPIK